MTTKAQLYLNEQTTKRSFEEELAAKDRENARLAEALRVRLAELENVEDERDEIFITIDKAIAVLKGKQ